LDPEGQVALYQVGQRFKLVSIFQENFPPNESGARQARKFSPQGDYLWRLPLDLPKDQFLFLAPSGQHCVTKNQTGQPLVLRFDKPGQYEIFGVYLMSWPDEARAVPPLNKWAGTAVSGVLRINVRQ